MNAAVFFWGGGESASGPSGGVIVLLALVLCVGLPVLVGLLLRRRDARRRNTGADAEVTKEPPPKSGRFFSWDASEPLNLRARSTRDDWMVVGAFAVGVLILLLVTQT